MEWLEFKMIQLTCGLKDADISLVIGFHITSISGVSENLLPRSNDTQDTADLMGH